MPFSWYLFYYFCTCTPSGIEYNYKNKKTAPLREQPFVKTRLLITRGKLLQEQGSHRTRGTQRKSLCLSAHRGPVTRQQYR